MLSRAYVDYLNFLKFFIKFPTHAGAHEFGQKSSYNPSFLPENLMCKCPVWRAQNYTNHFYLPIKIYNKSRFQIF